MSQVRLFSTFPPPTHSAVLTLDPHYLFPYTLFSNFAMEFAWVSDWEGSLVISLAEKALVTALVNKDLPHNARNMASQILR